MLESFLSCFFGRLVFFHCFVLFCLFWGFLFVVLVWFLVQFEFFVLLWVFFKATGNASNSENKVHPPKQSSGRGAEKRE